MTPQELESLRANMRNQAATRIAELNAPAPEAPPAANPLKGAVKNPTAVGAYLRGNTVDPAKTQSMVKMGMDPDLARTIENTRRYANAGLSEAPKLGDALSASGNRAGFLRSVAGDTNYGLNARMQNFVEPALKGLPAPTQGPIEAQGPRMPPGQRYASAIGPGEAAGPRLPAGQRYPSPIGPERVRQMWEPLYDAPAGPPEMAGPRNDPRFYRIGPSTPEGWTPPSNMIYDRAIGPVEAAGPRMPPGMRYTSPIGPAPRPTGAMADLRAIGGSLGDALGRAKGAVVGSRWLNNPLTRTLGRAVGPLGTAAGLYSAYDELTDPTSRANQHNALYNQALEEGRYGDAVGEGAMSVANTVGAATGTRGIYDFLAGLGGGGAAVAAGGTPAAAAPAAAPKTPGNMLPIFAQNNQLTPLPKHPENETPTIRIFRGGDAQHPEIFNRNDETGRYDYMPPADPGLANELQKAAIEARGRVAVAQAGVERAAAGRHPMDQLTADLYQKKAAVDEQLQQLNPAQPDYKQRRQQLLLWQKMFTDRMNELPKFYPRLNASTYVDSSAGEDTNYGK